MIATTVFVLNLTLPDEIILKGQETLRTVYGNADVSIKTVEPFSIDDLKIANENMNYVGISQLEVSLGDKQAIIYATNIEKTKEIKMLGSDIPDLNKNEVVINTKQAEKYGYKEGDLITFSIENKNYELKIVKIVSKNGLTSLDIEFPLFIASQETVNEIRNIESGKFDTIFIDVENNDNVKSFSEYIKDNNENYIVEKLVDIEAIKEQISFISYIMILIFVMATIMIFFVVNSLNKVIIAERMPVIGTFRSVGATKGKMNFILILENVIYGIIGGIIGSFVGYGVNSKAASLFIMTSGVELTNETSQMTIGTMLIGVAFAVLLELVISIKAIMKANKRPIKDIIFDVQSTRYVIKKSSAILGILMFVLSLTINYFNKDMQLLPTILSIILLIVGVANLVPTIMRIISIALATISKKIGWATGVIASKNIGYNKMLISSSRLIVVAVSLMLAILTVSSSVSKVFTSFSYIWDIDVIVKNVSKSAKEYEKLLEIDGVRNIEYLYSTYDVNSTYNEGKNFTTIPTFIGLDKSIEGIKELDYKVEDLKYDELLIDEKLAQNNDIAVNDIIKIKLGTLNKELEFKVVGLVNSTYFSTSRNVIVINLQNFTENLTDVPYRVQLTTDNGTNIEEVKAKVKDTLKEVGLKIQTFDEYIAEQEEQANSIMNLFYIIVGLAAALAFIGIVNNQIISFMQRNKELAILNSTCMSKTQLKRMLRTETILVNAISCLIAIGVGFIATGIIESFMQGLAMYVEMVFNWKTALEFVGIIFIILLLTLIIPSRRLKKMNVVNAIKYE